MSETTQDASQVTLQEALDKTDFGHWLYDHRKSFIAAIIIVFLAASGLLLYRQYSAKEARDLSAKVYAFETKTAAPLREGKLAPTEFATQFKALTPAVKASPSLIPVVLQTVVYLDGKGETAQAYETLKQVIEVIGAKSPLYVFVAHTYAALAEKSGKTDEAIKTLEAYLAQGHKVLLAKAYLDLGRLYVAKQDFTRARTQFDYIVANYPNDELAKLARLYLQQWPATK